GLSRQPGDGGERQERHPGGGAGRPAADHAGGGRAAQAQLLAQHLSGRQDLGALPRKGASRRLPVKITKVWCLAEGAAPAPDGFAKPTRKFAGQEKVDRCKVAAEQHETYDRYVDGAPLMKNPNATPEPVQAKQLGGTKLMNREFDGERAGDRQRVL